MTSNNPTAVSKRHPALAALLTLLLVLTGIAFGASPARADVPEPPVSAPFAAPLCEGSTPSDPRTATGAVSDLTQVFGARLDAYNSGVIVPLYTNGGQNGGESPPVCAVRYVEGAGAVSEWMYCTDIDSSVCARTDADGNLVSNGSVLGAPETLGSNPRLTEEQERIIAYIITHEQSATNVPGLGSGTVTASNANGNQRWARQTLVWCISDYASMQSWQSGYCDTNMSAERQAEILALVPAEPQLTLDLQAGQDEMLVGESTQIDVTTNVYQQPIEIDVVGDAGAVEVCDGSAVFSDGILIVDGTDAANSTVITLCITGTDAGDVTVSAEATPAARDRLSWSQSPGANGVVCQVFAALETTREATITSAVTVRFVAAADEEEETEETDGTTDEGTTDEGTTDDGTTDEGTTDDGTTDNGTDNGTDDGTTDNGTDGGSTDAGAGTDANVDTEAVTNEQLAVSGGTLAWGAGAVGIMALVAGAVLLTLRRRQTV